LAKDSTVQTIDEWAGSRRPDQAFWMSEAAVLHRSPGLPRPLYVERSEGGLLKPCLLIPIFDHASTIRGVVESLASANLPLVIVNDGSGPSTRQELDCIAKDFDWVEICHHRGNLGKGAALVTGYRLAAERGFTHVVQLDADAQHDAADVRRFLAEAHARPDALVLGAPIFDADAPRSRVYGRKLSVGMVWLATLSRAVRDPLCGFRCVPLALVMPLLDRVSMGRHMDFEPELAVRLVWSGAFVVNVRTRVRYYPFGLSHFDVVWDDLRLVWLYTRLTFGMLVRAGGMIRRSAALQVPARATRTTVKT
jgi:glycosyltransferase involved in cell wall biosynthesis